MQRRSNPPATAAHASGRGNGRASAWVIWSACAASWAIIALALLLLATTTNDVAVDLAWVLGLGAFATVGAVVVTRQPRNTVGWLCYAIGLLGGLAVFTAQYAEYTLARRPGSLPDGLAMGWLGQWLGNVWAGLTLTILPLLFPTGRPPTRRWRPVGWACAVAIAAACAVAAVTPGPLGAEPGLPRNPLGIEGAEATLQQIQAIVLLGLGSLTILCAASVAIRFRRARGVERQQLKWFAYGAALLALLFASFALTDSIGVWDRWVPYGVSNALFGLGYAMIPVTAGIAILRYRLYDIDRIIHRTLVFGLLTAVLGAIYAGVVLVLGQLFGGIGGEPPSWAVAGATLAVAALFQPARRRIQQAVDRRFNRRRYDAAKTIEEFSIRLRNQVDLNTLAIELLEVVDETMEPTAVSLWLRPPMERSRHSLG